MVRGWRIALDEDTHITTYLKLTFILPRLLQYFSSYLSFAQSNGYMLRLKQGGEPTGYALCQ